jgi:uncharacterized LabA/DUF88 family protein
MSESPHRVVIFADYMNVFNDARTAFHRQPFGPSDGQVDPIQLGRVLTAKRPPGATDRACHEVRVYRGRPDPRKEPQTNAAHMRQCRAWESAGARVITRPLRYPRNWRPGQKVEEKGIDVQIAIDMVMMAINGDLDVAILASTDTDQRPVLEAFHALPLDRRPIVEVMAWRSETANKRLNIPDHHVWAHFLEVSAYRRVRDKHDYNLA